MTSLDGKTLISFVVALSANNVIGRDGGLPWRLSTDLKRFKALTLGKPVLMGRVCYDSIGRPLPGRPNIVMTRSREFSAPGVLVAHSFDQALALGEAEAGKIGAAEIAVIGGGVIYELAMDRADILHVTHIDQTIEGDTFFPAIDPSQWQVTHSENVAAGDRDDFATRFVTYRRRA